MIITIEDPLGKTVASTTNIRYAIRLVRNFRKNVGDYRAYQWKRDWEKKRILNYITYDRPQGIARQHRPSQRRQPTKI